MKLFQKFIFAACLSEAKRPEKRPKKVIKKTNGNRNVEVDDLWTLSDNINRKPPTETCSSFGKHSSTGEDGFGLEYGYNLQYQGSNGGFNGFLYLDNYHDFMNCYVDITANPECEAISITYTSVAVEQCDARIGYGNGVWKDVESCECDRFWISNENKKFPKQCGCNGDGCDDILWSRNVTHPITGEEDYYAYYYEDEYMNEDGTYNLTAIYENTGAFGDEGIVGHDGVDGVTSQVVFGNKFRFNFQSDYALSHGEVRLDWECVDGATTTEWTPTTTTATTTSGTTTTETSSGTTTTVPATINYTTTTPYTTTTSYTTATLTEPYPSCHPGLAGPGCATTTTGPGLPDGTYESLTWNEDSCYRYPLGRDHFRTRIVEAISTAVDNDKLTLSHNGRDTVGSAMRRDQFIEWLHTVFNIFYFDIIEENPRKCLAEKFKDSVEQGETGLIASYFLSNDELGSDCALDIEDGDIDNACQKLDDFFVWAYEDCQTEGSHVLSKLRHRCERINDIRKEIADRE